MRYAVSMLLASLVLYCNAIDIKGHIAPTNKAGKAILPLAPDSAVVLDGGNSGKGYITADGTFVVHNVPTGKYVLSVLDREYSFPSYTVTVPKDSASQSQASQIQVHPYTIGRSSSDQINLPGFPYPIVFVAVERLEYYDIPQPFSIPGLIKQNKMILLMVGGIIFAVGLPKLLLWIDPETLKEVQANQAEMHRNMQSVQNLGVKGSLGKLLSGNEIDLAVSSGSAPSTNTARKRKPA